MINPINPIDAMQAAVDVVLSSPHPDNKVAAAIFAGQSLFTATNNWPEPILTHLGTETRIGDSSGTVHAEVGCLLGFGQKTDGASLAITDPCCPNCAKCIAEAGIKAVYIDHKGFEKDFAQRRGGEFQDMSLRILAHAGIAIYKLWRKEKLIEVIHQPEENYTPPEDNPIEIRPTRMSMGQDTLLQTARLVKVKHPRWGCALATDPTGKIWTLVASAHPAIGFTSHDTLAQEGKYDFYLEPANRLLMGAARAGLTIADAHLWCSVLPSPREMVNLVAAGLMRISLQNGYTYKKTESLDAKETLSAHKILTFTEVAL